jgi:hypothetical protein
MRHLATDVEGIFRLSGAAKRIKELQAIFDSPDRYGKGLDWTGYTVHDAANILRRYLNQLPQPIVPLDYYEKFRDPLRGHQVQAVGDMEAEAQVQSVGDFDHDQAILTYQRLITELPPLNRQLLLYILDLLAVFSSKSEINRMTSRNLASIFQPGMLSHPIHDMTPQEYRLSQDVVIFLIDNQDSFLIGMSGTAADEKTVKDIQTSAQNRQPSSPSIAKAAQAGLGRSASNASAGADSLRKFGGVRRNMSVSSKNSKNSMNVPSPVPLSPASPHGSVNTAGGVHRSNTLPSKKSPSIPSRFNTQSDSPTTTSTGLAQGGYLSPSARTSSPSFKLAQAQPNSEGRTSSTASSITPTAEAPSSLATVNESAVGAQSKELLIPMEKLHLDPPPPPPGFATPSGAGTPPRERKVSGFFAKSATSDNERKDSRPPNKLRKKRLPGSANPSAQSSANSLHAEPDSPQNQAFYTPLPTPGVNTQVNADPLASLPPSLSNTDATPVSESAPHLSGGQQASNMPPKSQLHHNSDQTLKPSHSPTHSNRSRVSVADQTDQSEADHTDDPAMKNGKKEKKRRWRLSSSTKKNGDVPVVSPSSSSRLGSNAIAENSTSSVGSITKPQKSTTLESQQLGTEATIVAAIQTSSTDSTPSRNREASKEKDETTEKKGPIGWFKAKVAQAKEERKEREAEKERTKSPPRVGSEHATSKQSLSAIAQERKPSRGRSMDVQREAKAVDGNQPSGPAHGES